MAASVAQAFYQPARHPMETVHTLWSGIGTTIDGNDVTKINIKSASKITTLAWSAINFSKHLFEQVPAFSELQVSCDVIKLFGKLCDADNIVWGFSDRTLFQPGTNAKGPANTTGIDGCLNIPYIIKISTLSIATILQTFQTCQKYVHPQFFTQAGEAFVAYTGNIALTIGGERLAAIASVVTSAGATTAKNYCLIIFLAIEGYQCYCRFSTTNDIKKQVYHEIKTFENLGKIACISMCIFGAPSILIAGTGLLVAYTCLVTEYQKAIT